MAFSPLANGLLTDRYDKKSQFDSAYDYRSVMPQFQAEAMEKNGELLALLREMAGENHATPAQISMAWMLCKKPYIAPIPGTRKTNRMEENAVVFDAGTIGIAAAIALKYFGCEKVMVRDHLDLRLKKAENLGMETCNNGREDLREKAIRYFGEAVSLNGRLRMWIFILMRRGRIHFRTLPADRKD